MKEYSRRLLLMFAVTVVFLCSMTLISSAADTSGMYDVSVNSGFSYEPQSASGLAITAGTVTIDNVSKQLYAGAEQIKISYQGAVDGKNYLLFALNDGSGVPTQDNIAYVDQKTASSGVSFSVYPASLEDGKTYSIFLSSNDGVYNGLTKIGSFKYYSPYMLGDVNSDTRVNSRDAVAVLRHSAKISLLTGTDLSAGDVNKDSRVNSADAVLILKLSAKLISEFPN